MTQSFAQFILPAAAIFVAEFMECRSVIHDGKVRQLVVYDVIYQFFGIKQQIARQFYIAARIASPQYPAA